MKKNLSVIGPWWPFLELDEEETWFTVWRNWWTSSTSPLVTCVKLQEASATPITALRSDQKTCGLFDTCGTGVTDGKVASETFAQLTDFTTIDFLSTSSLGDNAVVSMLQIPDTAASDELENSFNSNSNDGFCEVFTDLSDFLLETVNPAEFAKRGRKRTVTEAILTAMESGDGITSVPASPVDHNDYTLKPKKRARIATVTSESDAESTISSVSSSTSPYVKTEKYVERRSKNNIASKRSRETRKQKFSTMEEEVESLQERNQELEAKVHELEAMAKDMKAMLIQRLVKA